MVLEAFFATKTFSDSTNFHLDYELAHCRVDSVGADVSVGTVPVKTGAVHGQWQSILLASLSTRSKFYVGDERV